MNTKNMAIAGAGLVVAGVGLSAIGAALIIPAIVQLTASVVEKTSNRLASEVERGSRVIGTAAGTLQRSFAEAAKAGMKEIRTTRSGGREQTV
jgi:hypothetical protein